jgi:hypothetical protein
VDITKFLISVKSASRQLLATRIFYNELEVVRLHIDGPWLSTVPEQVHNT